MDIITAVIAICAGVAVLGIGMLAGVLLMIRLLKDII